MSETYTHSDKTNDSDSPVGYWVRDLSYPIFSDKSDHAGISDQLHSKLKTIMNRYQCSDGGDESFEAEIRTLERDLVSMRYVAMWACSAMPSPDSVEGSINLALPSLNAIHLESQFLDQGRYEEFLEEVKSLHASKMAEKGQVEECSFSKWDYFTLEPTTISLHFDKSAHYPSDCASEVEFLRKEMEGLVSQDSFLAR